MPTDTNNIQPVQAEDSQIVLYQPDETISLEVKLEQETVWLTQAQMTELFQTTRNNITMHIRNIFKEGELEEILVCKESLLTTPHGAIPGKVQQKKVKIYNLDVIISVGYRVKSKRGTQFRQWATRVLREYLLQGHAINQKLIALQQQMDSRLMQMQEHTDNRLLRIEDRLTANEDQINFFVKTNLPPHEGCVFQGHLLEGRDVAEQIIRSATSHIILIDAYVGADTFHMLEVRKPGVTCTIYTERVGANIQTLQHDHEAEYGTARHIEVLPYRTNFHDRFLIIDETVYHFGASLKDLGRRLFAFDVINLPKDLILTQVQ